jgi:hypothetical protein
VAIRKVGSVGVIVGVSYAGAAVLLACGQGPTAPASTLTTSSEALQTVLGCQSDWQTCDAAAKSVSDVTQCDQQLRSCLMSLLPEGGLAGPSLPTLPNPFDAAPPLLTPPNFPGLNLPGFPRLGLPPPFGDAGLPQLPPLLLPDAGFRLPPLLAFPDAGLLPRLPPFPDAGALLPPFTPPTPPVLPGLPDAGLPGAPGGLSAQLMCQVDLQNCLLSQTPPTTCADNARTCLTAAAKAQCDAQEQSCLAAGIQQAVCTAQRQACGP